MLSRRHQGRLAEWWWTIEKPLLYCCFILIGIGILLSFAASPSLAMRIGRVDPYSFVKQHILFSVPALLIVTALSFLSVQAVRRFSALLFAFALLGLILTLFIGVEVKGAVRWIRIFGFGFQPSEFAKPALIVLCAVCFSEQKRDTKLVSVLIGFAVYLACAVLFMLQPDVGQTLLISVVWLILFILSGISVNLILVFALAFIIAFISAYFFIPHVHDRIYGFVTGQGNNFQLDIAREAILHGGWFGQGPGEGTIKNNIPDSHTDFVFAVAVEEYGVLLSAFIVAFFIFIVSRTLLIALKEKELFTKFAIIGLSSLIGLQASINISVNLGLLPAKGMTLPFISYGGSSMISSAITMGLLLALTRKRPEMRASL